MITFSRSKLVGVERLDENTLLAHGVLEDFIYAMELDVSVKQPDFEIVDIKGRMKRVTTPVCDQAIPKLQNAVGLRIPEDEFARKIHRVVGKEGCTHFANLLVECCDAIMQTAIYENIQQAPNKHDFLKEKTRSIPSLKESCVFYSKMAETTMGG
ncbi:MAG: DUF2889 domain-containing protein [Chloroflexota bacterium]|nr:DUF2889 domain-containing protein [Chloroflexota bacterium]